MLYAELPLKSRNMSTCGKLVSITKNPAVAGRLITQQKQSPKKIPNRMEPTKKQERVSDSFTHANEVLI